MVITHNHTIRDIRSCMNVIQAKAKKKNISPNTFKKLVHVAFPHFMHWLENIEAITQINNNFQN